ncbi:MAG TPA: hypothetical protein VF603_10915 [Allosphingosinicella sp.]
MQLTESKIIAPDSSHWAKWIDAVSSGDPIRRQAAKDFHRRLLDQGVIPLLSWHHLEELLGVEDSATARARIAFLQSLPLIAWLRLPTEQAGVGSIVEVLTAEAIAASEGHSELISIRDRARELLLKTGSGTEALGEESWVWEAVRPVMRSRKGKSEILAAVGPLRLFDENRTIGELSKAVVNSPTEMHIQFRRIHARVLDEIMKTTGDAGRAKALAEAFMVQVLDAVPSPGTSVRDLLVSSLMDQGLDEEEIRDDRVLADLSNLAVFRSQLRLVASATGRSFETLKKVPMAHLPSRVIGEALKAHGQRRHKRPASDVNDTRLGVLAAYCAVLYVDKRTAEDFTRARRKEPRLRGLIGDIAKAADFDELLGPC